MLDVEARRLCCLLLDRGDISPLLSLGSSSRHFREAAQPHIASQLFEPLHRAGVEVVHSDVKAGAGVDLAGDILDPATVRAMQARRFRCVLLANLLEHVRDRASVAAACEDIVGPGGLILATVPSSYPYHADPIDTLYRPSPDALAGLFARSRTLSAEEVVGPTYRQHLEALGVPVWREASKTALWALILPARPRSAASKIHRWLWYSRPYRVAVVLMAVR